MIPFFVVDRPISLEIIGGLVIPAGKQIGLMAHANTSLNFRRAFREYSYQQVVKMCDSAIFDNDRSKTTYADLYSRYEEMGADYGVMIDVLRDPKATLESAEKALEVYSQQKCTFNLVAVTQGANVREYLDCYEKLKEMGFEYIAVGGLLHKRDRSARYMRVPDEQFMREILRSICNTFNPHWLFALGCLHPSRIELFKELNVWGDYKGWIFEYEKRDASLKESIEKFTTNHLEHTPPRFKHTPAGVELIKVLTKRQSAIRKSGIAHAELLVAKRRLRDLIIEIEGILKEGNPDGARLVAKFRARGLLQDRERDQILQSLSEIQLEGKYKRKLNSLINDSRAKKTAYVNTERRREDLNQCLLTVLRRTKDMKLIDSQTRKLAAAILKVLGTSEQSHRIRQVHVFIGEKILEQI